MSYNKRLIISCLSSLIFVSGPLAYAQSCLGDYPASSYYRAEATAATEEEARSQAVSQLVAQFPSTYSARKQERQTEVNGELGGIYSSTMEVSSKLRLMGVQYYRCPGKRRSTTFTVVAYISKQDLERSAAQVGAKVQEYVGLMGSAGSDTYVREGLIGYLYAHLSPKAVQVRADGAERPDAEAWLESVLRDHLTGLRLTCTGVEEQNGYPGQLLLRIDVQGGAKAVDLMVEVPAYNARDRISAQGGVLHIIMEPGLRRETIRAVVSLTPQVLPQELRDVAAVARITRDVALQVDFSPVIKIEIEREDKGRDWSFKPVVRGLSMRQYEWLVDGRQRSFQTNFILAKTENAGTVRLRVNESDDLSAEVVLRAAVPVAPPVVQEVPAVVPQTVELPVQAEARETEIIPPAPKPVTAKPPVRKPMADIPNSILRIAAAPEARALEGVLGDLQRSGKIMTGRKHDFQEPDRCWVAVVGRESRKMLYLLAPGRPRTDVVSSRTFSDFEQDLAPELNGSAVLWIEVYDQY